MSRVGVFYPTLLILLMRYYVESCDQLHIQAQVPEILEPGYVVSQVNLEGCGGGPLSLTSSDPAFTVQMDGTIQAVTVTTVPRDGTTFWITVKDNKGQIWNVDVTIFPIGQTPQNVVLRRAKRRWSPPPFSVKENDQGPFPKDMEMIASDTSVNFSLYYKINGPGVDENPMGVFTVTDKGLLRVHRTIDREQNPKFVFVAHAYNTATNRETDNPLPITVMVLDENDNAPQFSGSLDFAVQEQCPMGTMVGTVNATDKDEPNTLHTKIKYTLLNGTNLFRIDPYKGVITAITNTLDREATEKHIVALEIRDMGGAPNGLFSRANSVISLTDINDNPPTFLQPSYTAHVEENKANTMVLRIPVEDKDLKNTPNWRALYDITKGNENGNFMIKTDPATNEGLLHVTKPLDYEKQQMAKLEVTARNEAPLVASSSALQKVPVELRVDNVDEGPEFIPPILVLKIKENVPNGTLIGTYTATDPETKTSQGIKYYKLTDQGSWINVNEKTGELKTAMTIDRESPLVHNNTYNITVIAVDATQKTGTGTVIINIEDVNDNVPLITQPDQVLCSKDVTARGSVLIEAKDLDQKPYSDPFTFELSSSYTDQWKLTGATGTSVLLQPIVDLPNDMYDVPVTVKDLQGFGKEQTVSVRVCNCVADGTCSPKESSATLGVWGILALLLGLLLLLLLCLLCVCACNTKGEKIAMADDGTACGNLLSSNFEGPGEEVKDTLLMFTASGADITDNYKANMMEQQNVLTSSAYGQNQTFGSNYHQGNMQGYMTTNTFTSGQYSSGIYGNASKKYSTMPAMGGGNGWRENEIYLNSKLAYLKEEADTRYADDILKPYGYEGAGSAAGSVGCCSIITETQSMEFLNSFGPKFKTLADICTSKPYSGGK